MNSPKLSPDCAICCSSFTLAKRAPVKCSRCGFRACRECVQKYVLSQETLAEIQCMMPDCDCVMDRPFLVKNLTQVFMNKTYREHRCNLLYHQELSRMPETMGDVELRKELYLEKAEKEATKAQLAVVADQYQALKSALWHHDRNIYRIEHGQQKQKNNPFEREFIRACPVSDCRGFLSKQWKCKVCDILVCSKCYEIKENAVNGGGEEHVCDENILKTAQFLKRDTKPCPTCGSLIHKISGCDQMWCTRCHVAFSWRTGRQVNGLVHNPHFYEWQRQDGGGAAPRVPGDVPCGGYPRFRHFRNALGFFPRPALPIGQSHLSAPHFPPEVRTEIISTTTLYEYLLVSHRHLLHFRRIEMPADRRIGHTLEEVGKILRVDYLLKECTEESFKKRIIAHDIRFTKENDVHHVMELMGAVALECIQAIYTTATETMRRPPQPPAPAVVRDNAIAKILTELDKLFRVREYCNNELKKISRVYNQCVPFISQNFYTTNERFKKKDLGW